VAGQAGIGRFPGRVLLPRFERSRLSFFSFLFLTVCSSG
jgi:hypothetical protein